MGRVLIVIAGLAAAHGLWFLTTRRQRQALVTTTFVSNCPPDQIRNLFRTLIEGPGWWITNEGNPMIGRSREQSGAPQEIHLHIEVYPTGKTSATLTPIASTEPGTPLGDLFFLRTLPKMLESALRERDPEVFITARPAPS